jgi:hypothetical protein
MLSFKSSRYPNVYSNSKHQFCIRIREHSNPRSYSSKNVVKSAIRIRFHAYPICLLCLSNSGEQEVRRARARWRPPAERWVKLDTDGAFDSYNGWGAGAAVLRDHLGQVRGGA